MPSSNHAGGDIPQLIEKPNSLDGTAKGDSAGDMIRGGFLSANDRRALIGIARDGLEEHRVARRANAIILLDRGWSCERVAAALLLDDDTVRDWHRAYEQGGVEGLKSFGHEGSSSHLTDEQAIALGDWVDAHCPRSIRKIGAWLKRSFGLSYSRSGLIAMLVWASTIASRRPCRAASTTPNSKPSSTNTRTCSTRWASMRPSPSSMRFIRPIR